MRRLILAIMIVLLPLRGWIGDAMAVDTVTGAQVAFQSVAAEVHPTLEIGHFDADSGHRDRPVGPSHCPDHGSPLDDGPDTDGEAAAHGQACTVCQVCHTVAMSADAAPFPALPLPGFAPATSFPRFTSALPAPGLKPPIS